MTSRLEQLMERAGPPTRIVIYLDNNQVWRFAIYHTHGVADGYLDISHAATPEAARAAAQAKLQEICQRFYQSTLTVDREPPQANGMIAGQIHAISSEPPA